MRICVNATKEKLFIICCFMYESSSITYEFAEVRNAHREQSRTVVIGARNELM